MSQPDLRRYRTRVAYARVRPYGGLPDLKPVSPTAKRPLRRSRVESRQPHPTAAKTRPRMIVTCGVRFNTPRPRTNWQLPSAVSQTPCTSRRMGLVQTRDATPSMRAGRHRYPARRHCTRAPHHRNMMCQPSPCFEGTATDASLARTRHRRPVPTGTSHAPTCSRPETRPAW